MATQNKTQNKKMGGAAAQAGLDYQNRVAAYLATQILAERRDLKNLPPGKPTFLRCETEEPVDDILLGTDKGGFAFIQVKRSVTLNKGLTSLSLVIDQFVRQYIVSSTYENQKQPWKRPLDIQKDRLVLIVSPKASKAIKIDLADLLSRHGDYVQATSAPDVLYQKDASLLTSLKSLTDDAWNRALGKSPSEEDFAKFLKLIRILMLDVEPGESRESEAQLWLENSTVAKKDDRTAAWEALIRFSAQLSIDRAGADISRLRNALVSSGVRLKSIPSQAEDINKLIFYSKETAKALADLREIRLGTATIRINRRVVQFLFDAADKQSLLVVGDPGAGKSGALFEFVRLARSEGRDRDVVFIAADRLTSADANALQNELGLGHRLQDLLRNWTGPEPGFLVIDALDTARAEPAARALRELIQAVIQDKTRWKVVASVRTYDLRHSPRLRALFSGSASTVPQEFRNGEFAVYSHIKIPVFDAAELSEIASQAPELNQLLKEATSELKDLLSVPFNLRVAAELLTAGMDPKILGLFRTRIEILNEYWERRVKEVSTFHSREKLLLYVCTTMVTSRKMHLDRLEIPSTFDDDTLTSILHDHVLAEWRPSSALHRHLIIFSHNVIFDYSVARLILRGSPDELASRVENDPDVIMMIRPSIVMRFQELWYDSDSRHNFWIYLLGITGNTALPEIVKVIGPQVVTELTPTLADLGPILSAIDQGTPPALQAFQHIVGALLGGPHDALFGKSLLTWCLLLESASTNFKLQSAVSAAYLLWALCDSLDNLNAHELAALGNSARNLFRFAIKQTQLNDSWLMIRAIRGVCRTFTTNQKESEELLVLLLTKERLSTWGYAEIPWLTRDIRYIQDHAPQFVFGLYIAVFSHEEKSEDPTDIAKSKIFGLRSTKRQDFKHAKWDLGEKFPAFIATNPLVGCHIAVEVTRTYITQEHSNVHKETPEKIQFGPKELEFISDWSSIWDWRTSNRDEDALVILAALFRFISDEARVAHELLHLILDVIVDKGSYAIFWRKLLKIAIDKQGGVIARYLRPALTSLALFRSMDTTELMAQFLFSEFPLLPEKQRVQIEEFIVGLSVATNVADDEQGLRDERLRNALLSGLGSNLTSQAARSIWADLPKSDDVAEKAARRSGPSFGYLSHEQYLAAIGESPDNEAQTELEGLIARVSQFGVKFLNSTPSAKDLEEIVPFIRELHGVLAAAGEQSFKATARERGLDAIAEACALIADLENLGEPLGELTTDLLIELSTSTDPPENPEEDTRFAEHPSWGRPAPRLVAAGGLCNLAKHATYATEKVLSRIQDLSRDPVAAVRFQIFTRLVSLYFGGQETLMWSVFEQGAELEVNRGVLSGIVSSFQRLFNYKSSEVAKLTSRILGRFSDDPSASDLVAECVSLLGLLYVWKNLNRALQAIEIYVDNPTLSVDSVGKLFFALRPAFTYAEESVDPGTAASVRSRAFSLAQRYASKAATETKRLLEEARQGNQSSETINSYIRILDIIGGELFFGSGAFEAKHEANKSFSKPTRDRFYREALPTLMLLADIGFPNLVHRMMEMMEQYVDVDPRGVFLLVSTLVKAGETWGYNYESLAVDLVVQVIQRYLAEYPDLLQSDEECRRALISTLDSFVRAGWPSASRLTYSLGDIYR